MTASAPQLVRPAYHTGPEFTQTLGPEVADLATDAGFTPDPEQRLGLDLIFALDRQSKSAAFEVGVVACRQNLKTGLFKQAALGWLFITEQRLVVWSAHEFNTALEALRDMVALLDSCAYLSRRVKRVLYANGQESIELTTGQRLIFKARTKSGGRGLTGDKVVLDEAFALRPDHMGALLPTLSARPDPQVVYGSSAGLVGSDVLRGVRDRGRRGSSPRLGYLEWGAPQVPCEEDPCDHEVGVEGCALDRRDLWQMANPLLGRTRENGTGLTEEYIESERQAMPPHEFARERLGWWDEPGTAEAFGPGKCELGETRERPTAKVGALALAASFDLTKGCMGAAAHDGDVVYLKPLAHGPGTGWLVAEAKALQVKHRVDVVVDSRGPAASLIPHLQRERVRLKIADTSDVLDACADLFNAVRNERVHHGGDPELDDAVAGAVKRPVGDRWAWGRKQSTSDISPLEAVTLAAWHAKSAPKRSTKVRKLR